MNIRTIFTKQDFYVCIVIVKKLKYINVLGKYEKLICIFDINIKIFDYLIINNNNNNNNSLYK